MDNKIKAVSLFSSAGIGELLIPRDRFQIIVANELIKKRALCYEYFYPDTKMIQGDISDEERLEAIIDIANQGNAKLLIATPPCQGVSTLGKNKHQSDFKSDYRNYLVLNVLKIIDQCDFNYILIENVPRFLDLYLPYNNNMLHIEEILRQRYSEKYEISVNVLNAEDYGVPQSRPRAIIRMWKHGKKWALPQKEKIITLREAIGDLPSLEAGEDSGIKWHYAKKENDRAVLAMKHTAPGHSALKNEFFYPKKADGSRIKGFHNTYKRMVWDAPCPARTMYCGSISSHNNVHPGHLLKDGTYSDARVLTLLETFIVSSIPKDITFPKGTTDGFIRSIIGEAIPPRMMERILSEIEH